MVGAIIIGVQKSGTTTLASWIAQHPDVRFCDQKEPDFFSRTTDWRANLVQYHSLFEEPNVKGKSNKLWIEASTSYSWHLEFPDVSQKLYEYNPELKLIYIVREPIPRLKSHYKHNYLKGHTRKEFKNAVLEDPEYLAHSSYELQIRPFIAKFPRENILFLRFEDLISHEPQVLNEVVTFLNLSPLSCTNSIDLSAQNKTESLKKVSPLKKCIAPFFRFVPIQLRLKFRGIMYSEHKVDVVTSPELENQLYEMLANDIAAFRELTGIDYIRNQAND